MMPGQRKEGRGLGMSHACAHGRARDVAYINSVVVIL